MKGGRSCVTLDSDMDVLEYGACQVENLRARRGFSSSRGTRVIRMARWSGVRGMGVPRTPLSRPRRVVAVSAQRRRLRVPRTQLPSDQGRRRSNDSLQVRPTLQQRSGRCCRRSQPSVATVQSVTDAVLFTTARLTRWSTCGVGLGHRSVGGEGAQHGGGVHGRWTTSRTLSPGWGPRQISRGSSGNVALLVQWMQAASAP